MKKIIKRDKNLVGYNLDTMRKSACLEINPIAVHNYGVPRGFGDLGSNGNCFGGAREQSRNFGDIGSLAKKQKQKEKIRKSLHFV